VVKPHAEAPHASQRVGDVQRRIALRRYGRNTLTVKVGDTVHRVMNGPDDVHTITLPETGDVLAFIGPFAPVA